jgi:hypothetical protein
MAAFATSYIPTQASQVTRAADNASMLGDNFATWFNQVQGTIAVRFDYVGGGSDVNANNRFTLDVSDGTSSNRHIIYNVAASAQAGLTQAAGVGGGLASAGTVIPVNTAASAAYAVKLNDFAFSLNGSAASTNNVGAMPTGLSRLNLGSGLLASAAFLNGHIRSISYYNQRLPNATLQAITQ